MHHRPVAYSVQCVAMRRAVTVPPPPSPQTWLPLLGDWYWERDRLKQYHRLVESCAASAAGLPCNPHAKCTLDPAPSACESQMKTDGCLDKASAGLCDQCAQQHTADLTKAGCTRKEVGAICKAV